MLGAAAVREPVASLLGGLSVFVVKFLVFFVGKGQDFGPAVLLVPGLGANHSYRSCRHCTRHSLISTVYEFYSHKCAIGCVELTTG